MRYLNSSHKPILPFTEMALTYLVPSIALFIANGMKVPMKLVRKRRLLISSYIFRKGKCLTCMDRRVLEKKACSYISSEATSFF